MRLKKASLKVALTGPMGAGKSAVAELFRRRGARVIDADMVSRLLLEPRQPGWHALHNEFSVTYLNDDQTVDRKKLRQAIFSDRKIRERVNSLLHPLIRKAIDDIYNGQADHGASGPQGEPRLPVITVVEVPLLFEVGWQSDFDIVVVVTADRDVCLERVMRRDGVDHKTALAAFETQMSPSEKAELADYIIDNSGNIEATASQVDELYGKLAG